MNKATMLSLALMVALAADRADAQDVYVVDADGGPGSDATEIDTAIAMAGPFDTILVRTGTYLPFTIDGVGLTVVADTNAVVKVSGGIVVQNVPAGQAVVLRGLSNTAPVDYGLFAKDNAGSVRLESCAFLGASGPVPPPGNGYAGLHAEQCAGIVVERTYLTGGDGIGGVVGHGSSGASGLDATASTVAVYDSVLLGGDGMYDDDIGGNAGNGLQLIGGFTYLSGSQLKGGMSGGADDDYHTSCECVVCGYIPDGGSGLVLYGPSGSTAASLECTFIPGAGGETTSGEFQCHDGDPGSPVAALPGDYTALPGLSRGLRAPGPVREGESMELVFVGQPGDQALMLYSALSAQLFLQQFSGTLLVPPSSPILAVGTVPGDGTLEYSLVMPALPAVFESATILLQPVYAPVSGGFVLGGGSNLIALDQAF